MITPTISRTKKLYVNTFTGLNFATDLLAANAKIAEKPNKPKVM